MIHLLWATIRPLTFIKVYKIWEEKSLGYKDIKTYVCVNTKEDAELISNQFKKIDIKIISSKRRGVCEPSYALSSTLEGNKDDIVVFASDDFTPPNDWCNYLVNKLNGKEGSLMVNDGYQLPDSSNMLYPSMTIPIMTYGCLLKLNKVIYHPTYFHMFSDSELYLNLKDLGLLIDDRLSDRTIFEHHHYAAGKRNPDQADQSYNEKWKDDENTWNLRKKMSVEERIKI